jgi:hypothetical protein
MVDDAESVQRWDFERINFERDRDPSCTSREASKVSKQLNKTPCPSRDDDGRGTHRVAAAMMMVAGLIVWPRRCIQGKALLAAPLPVIKAESEPEDSARWEMHKR